MMPLDLSRQVVARWSDPDPAHAALLGEAGVNAVLLAAPHEAFARACQEAGILALPESAIRSLDLKELPQARPGDSVALKDGLWPGIARPPAQPGRGDETASASREPWIDANGFWIGYLRALYPKRPPVLGYLPPGPDRMVPFDSLELALIEAWVAGGNYILALDARYREALVRGEDRAREAWRALGVTARWLQANLPLFRTRTSPVITLLVEPGETTAEIANLMYRRNASPALEPAADPPPPDPQRRLAVVAADLVPPPASIRRRILAHAEAGSAVVVSGAAGSRWWDVNRLQYRKSEEDRDFYTLGRGQVVAYKGAIEDPSEFAMDVIDIVTHKRRAVRLWNAPAMIALATASPPGRGKALLHLVNYGSRGRGEIQARIQGNFSRATLLRPEATPLSLKAARRGTTTEIFISELKRLGVVLFE